ncbi:MAG: hypothetical protein KAS32_30935 [Candidatus Peribacteraceae bacterium]|nr:hypothetical protein [Candidatus Peribacteraceae bacterium]
MKLKKITINGISYLGKLVKDGDTTTLNEAMSIVSGKLTRDVLAEYLKLKNTGKLENGIEYTGQGGLFGVAPLTPTEKLDLNVCKMTMKHAKKVAAAGVENQVFSEMLGKQ